MQGLGDGQSSLRAPPRKVGTFAAYVSARRAGQAHRESDRNREKGEDRVTHLTAPWAEAKRLAGGLARFLCLVVALAGPISSRAAPPAVASAPTNLSGNSELMISYRHQERMWQTPDGALHLVINRGTIQPNPGLVLNSSFDGGVNWVPQVRFINANRNSTVDGVLLGSLLALVYGTADGGVFFAQLSYDSALRTWQVNRSEAAYSSSQLDADNPTIAIDDLGTAWCGFSVIDRITKDTHLRVIYRPSDGVWRDTGRVVGPVDHDSKERSARMIRLPGAMGMIFRVRQETFWTTRNDADPYDGLSTPVKILEGAPQRQINDPYSSHFSVIADDTGYLHLLVADDGDALYLRHSIGEAVWTPARKLNGRGKVAYLQIGMANGQVAVVFSAARGLGAVLLSQDSGESFREAFGLTLPSDSEGISYKTGRVEVPDRSVGAFPVLQQYEDHGQQRLMVYKVPAP